MHITKPQNKYIAKYYIGTLYKITILFKIKSTHYLIVATQLTKYKYNFANNTQRNPSNLIYIVGSFDPHFKRIIAFLQILYRIQ